MSYKVLYILLSVMSLCYACEPPETTPVEEKSGVFQLSDILPAGSGSLYIIGGGARPKYMVEDMVQRMDDRDGLILILPMASSSPDTSAWYAQRQFEEVGFSNIRTLKLSASDSVGIRTDSLLDASLIYICGGDQNRFMASLPHPAGRQKMHEAYRKGCVIAGTSAGAAVMSKVMITGDQLKQDEYESTYSRLESGNGMYAEGLGLLDKAIVDQHFVERSRYNRALTALHDHPGMPVFGISESTALVVSEAGIEVVGEGQVLLFEPSHLRADSTEKITGEVQLKILRP